MIESKLCSFPVISLLVWLVAEQDIRWWHRVCAGGGTGYVFWRKRKNTTNSAQIELELVELGNR